AIALGASPGDVLFARRRPGRGKCAEFATDDRRLVVELRQLSFEGGDVGIERFEPLRRGLRGAGGGQRQRLQRLDRAVLDPERPDSRFQEPRRPRYPEALARDLTANIAEPRCRLDCLRESLDPGWGWR